MADDDVYPSHFMDNSRGYKNFILAWTLRFNDILDGDKLNDALWRLFDTGDWRKLGGRLKVGPRGKLEIHVPKIFTKDRPPVAYTSETFDMAINEQPLAKDLPSTTEYASMHRPASDFRPLSVHPNTPSTLEELTGQDIPQISLHVVNFSDATLVSIAWPHALMDGMSLQGLLKSWSLVLAGKADQVPALLGAKDDLLYAAAAPPEPGTEVDWALKGTILTGFSFFLFVVRFMWSILTERVIECRTICFPKATMAKLHRQALNDIVSTQEDADDERWISEGDVIVAWGAKMVALAQPSPRPINAFSALDVRSRLPELAKATGVYIQNALVGASIQLSKDEARRPLGFTAARCREALTTQATTPQVRCFLQQLRKAWDAGGDPLVLPGAWNGELFTVTNWTKGDFVNVVDFSAAVVKAGESGPGRSNPPGTMIYHQTFFLEQDATVRNVIGVLGKDRDGNYWMTGYFPARTWTVIEKDMRKMSEDGWMA